MIYAINVDLSPTVIALLKEISFSCASPVLQAKFITGTTFNVLHTDNKILSNFLILLVIRKQRLVSWYMNPKTKKSVIESSQELTLTILKIISQKWHFLETIFVQLMN